MRTFTKKVITLLSVIPIFGLFVACYGISPTSQMSNDDLSTDVFLYDFTSNQNEIIIVGVAKENGDNILDIPETIDGKPVAQILSLDYHPNNEATSLHFTKFEKISIPSNVQTIYPYCFRDMIALQEVVFTENSQLEKIEQGAFKGCKNLKSFTFPNSLKHLEGEAFDGCTAFTSLHIPKNLETFSPSYTWGLTTLTVDKENVFYTAVDDVLYSKDKSILQYYPAHKPDESFTVLDSTTHIMGQSFMNCKQLKSINLNNTVKVDKGAFDGCEYLANITAEHLRFVDETPFKDTAWYKNYQGGEISLGKVLLSYTGFAFNLHLTGYVSIAPYAFQGHTNLHEITFDSELLNIGDEAFADCTNLYMVTFSNKSTMVYIDKNTFDNNAKNRYIKVYQPLYEKYAKNEFWKIYLDCLDTYE